MWDWPSKGGGGGWKGMGSGKVIKEAKGKPEKEIVEGRLRFEMERGSKEEKGS